MKEKTPRPICITILKFGLLSVAVGAVGIVFAIIENDMTFLMMSVVLALCFIGKCLSIRSIVKSGRYERYEGVVEADASIPLRRRHRLVMDEGETVLIIAGKPIAKQGEYVRLYLQTISKEADIPEQLRTPQALLGYEVEHKK